jgi:hypothetical protein
MTATCRGFCGARRMVDSAALLVDEVLPAAPMRQWVLSVPFALRFLFAANPGAMGEALRIVYRVISGFMICKAGLTRGQAQCGAVTLIQRFGSALNLNVHFHMLIPDGVYLPDTDPAYFRRVSAPAVYESYPFPVSCYSSGKDEPLLVHPPLRTVRASFPAYGSSLTKTPVGDPAARPAILWEDIKLLLPI